MSVSFSTVIQKLRPRPNAGTNLLSDYLNKIQPTAVTNIPNGMRVASEVQRGDFATIGIALQAGSRHEDRATQGAAAMLQKIALNGTGNSTRSALSSAIEEVGGHLNCYTNRDRSALYVKCHKGDIGKAVALLAEMVRAPKITDETVEVARAAQLSELKDYDEDIEQLMIDNMHTAAFDATEKSYGANPKGTPETVQKMTAQQISQYKADNWTAGRMMLIGCGSVKHDQLESLAKQYFGDLATSGPAPKSESRYIGGDIKFWNLRMKVSHFGWGFETCGADCGDVVPLTLVNHIYGRYGRQQHDLVNHSLQINYKCFSSMDHSTPTHSHFHERGIEEVTPFFHCYEDTGLMGLQITARPENNTGSATNFMDYIQLTMGDMCRLTQKACHPQELEQGKVNYKAQLMMNHDGPTNSFEDIARQVFYLNRRVPLEEMFARIDDITPTNIMETLQHYYYSRRPVLSYTGYCYQTPAYDTAIHWTYKYLY